MNLIEYIQKIPGHQNSEGEAAPWVILDHDDGSILSSHKTKKDAQDHLEQMKTYSESRLSEQFALSDLDANAISDITAEYLFDREHGNGMNQNYLRGVDLRNNFLYIQYETMPSYDEPEHYRINAVPAPVPTTSYDTLFQFADTEENLGDQATFQSLSSGEKAKIVRSYLEDGNARVWCSCPAFYYQGHYEDMAKLDAVVFPFRGPKGDGIWHARHAPGLTQPGISICKHIAAAMHNLANRDVSKVIKGVAPLLPVREPEVIEVETPEVEPQIEEEPTVVNPEVPEDLGQEAEDEENQET